jgi:hypothetical protein
MDGVQRVLKALTDVYFGDGAYKDLRWSWHGPQKDQLQLDISESDWFSILGEGGVDELGDPFEVFWVVANAPPGYYPDMMNDYTVFWSVDDDDDDDDE